MTEKLLIAAYIIVACRPVVVFTGTKLPLLEGCESRHSGEEETTAEKRSCHQYFWPSQLWKEHSVECHPQKQVLHFTRLLHIGFE